MSSDVAIAGSQLSKRYRIGERERYRTLRGVIAGAASRLIGRRTFAQNPASIWALDDVSFHLDRGEVLGIIGRNGAGKSTLLKILSRITKPTRGRAEIHGRVGSLLEVGTGFHSELTGRENIFLNGAILGMKRREIARQFDEIVAFAEVDEFLDTPVKRYSSGMYMRLAFAVAAHLEPEILIVDEVLAVGDVAFQKKCLGKMDGVARSGRSILLVSHSMPAIQTLCHRALWLDHGKLVSEGRADQVVHDYLSSVEPGAMERVWNDLDAAPGDERVRLRRATVVSGDSSGVMSIQKPITLEFEYWNFVPDANIHLSVLLYNEEGVTVLNAEPVNEKRWGRRIFPAGLFRDVCTIPGGILNDGAYRAELLVIRDEGVILFRLESLLTFELFDTAPRKLGWYGKWPGVVRPAVGWETELVSEDLPSAAAGEGQRNLKLDTASTTFEAID